MKMKIADDLVFSGARVQQHDTDFTDPCAWITQIRNVKHRRYQPASLLRIGGNRYSLPVIRIVFCRCSSELAAHSNRWPPCDFVSGVCYSRHGTFSDSPGGQL